MSCKVTLWLVLLACMQTGCQDQGKGSAKKEESPPAETPGNSCKGDFVTKRMQESWYRSVQYDPVKCENPKTTPLKRTTSIPLYWVVAGDDWKVDEVKEKLDAAKAWFDRYCVTLDFHEVALKPAEKKDLVKHVNKHKDDKGNDYVNDLSDWFFSLWRNQMKKPKPKFLLLMFVDPFAEVRYSSRGPANVSGNFDDIPLIIITHADSTSKHIVTHELIHGLGKALGAENGKPHSEKFVTSVDNTWDEGGCSQEMGNAARTNPKTPMDKSDTAPMDWASYWEYAKQGAGTLH